MATVTGYLHNEEGDLIIENGDFKKGNPLDKEVMIVLTLQKGELKRVPLLGPNLPRLINSVNGGAKAKQAIRLALERDKKRVNSIKFNNGNIEIDAQHR